jgi:GTPase SAR1 family protein
VPQQHNYTKKKLINIANTKVIKEVSGPGTVGLTSLTLSWLTSINRENYSALAFATEYVNLYVVETTSQGQRKGLASRKIQLS